MVHLSKSASRHILVKKSQFVHTLQPKLWFPSYATVETLSLLSFQPWIVEAVSADHLVYTCHAQKGLLAVALVML